MDKLYAGIDVSKGSNVVYLMRPDGEKIKRFSVSNSPDGSEHIVTNILSSFKNLGLSEARIGIESTSVYGDGLMAFLRDHVDLKPFSLEFFVLNATQVKNFKKSYSDLPKNDDIDSFVIADCLRFNRIGRSMYMADYKYDALKVHTRARFMAVQNLTREKQRFANLVFLKFSGLSQSKVFSVETGATSLALLETFDSAEDIARLSIDELATFISEKGRKHFEDPLAIAEAVKAAVKNSYRPPKVIGDELSQAICICISTIRSMEKTVKEYDKNIERLMSVIPCTLTSVKGIGSVYASGIVAEIGDINRFDNQAALAKYAGLVWKEHQSGNFTGETTHLGKSGNRYLRYYLLEAANSLRRCDPEFKRYYNLKFKEVNKFQHKRALALTARKLVRLVFRLLKDNRLYTPPAEV